MKRFLAISFLAIKYAVFVFPQSIPTNGLVGWWPFNGNTNDASGNNNNGTVYGATLANDRFGNSDSAYYFDGVDDYINTNVNSGITNGLSIAFWFKSDHTNDWSGLITSRGYGNSFSGFSILPGGNICFYINTYTYVLTSNSNVLDNKWRFIVGTYNGNELKLYLNDTLIGTKSATMNVSVPDYYKIGKDEIASDRYINGIIDDIRIYNRALSKTEIDAIYNETPTGVKLITNYSVDVYPNPTNDKIFINTGKNFQKLAHCKIKLFNIYGSVIYQSMITKQPFEIKLGDFAKSGLYLIQILDSSNQVIDTRKIIFE